MDNNNNIDKIFGVNLNYLKPPKNAREYTPPSNYIYNENGKKNVRMIYDNVEYTSFEK